MISAVSCPGLLLTPRLSSLPAALQYAEEQPLGTPLMGVSIYYMREVTPKGHYGPRGHPERLVWARWECKKPGDEASAAVADAIQQVIAANKHRSRQPEPLQAHVQSNNPEAVRHNPRMAAPAQARAGRAVASGIYVICLIGHICVLCPTNTCRRIEKRQGMIAVVGACPRKL